VKKNWGHHVATVTAAIGLGLLVVGSGFAKIHQTAASASSAGAKPPFVTAIAPARGTVAALKRGKLAVTVTCKKACEATVYATIKPADAKRLGFPGAKGQSVLIGTGKKTLKALTPTKILVVPTSAAKKSLKGPVAIVGTAKGVPPGPGAVNTFVGWSTTLK
jgi:hypothetical protein